MENMSGLESAILCICITELIVFSIGMILFRGHYIREARTHQHKGISNVTKDFLLVIFVYFIAVVMIGGLDPKTKNTKYNLDDCEYSVEELKIQHTIK